MKPHPILRTVLIKRFSIFSNVQTLSVVPSRVVFYVIWVNVFCDFVERCGKYEMSSKFVNAEKKVENSHCIHNNNNNNNNNNN